MVALGAEADGDGEEGTYFVDQAGHYYFQAKGETQPVMTVMSSLPQQSAEDEDDEEFIINHDKEDEVTDVQESVSGSPTGILRR